MTDVAEQDLPAASSASANAVPKVALDLVHSELDARRAADALAAVWIGPDGQKPFPAELAWVLAHSGNYVAIAQAGDLVVGAAIGFRGVDSAGPFLHSHIAGVLPGWQGASIGFALKQHQRSWALGEGLDRICWTFDPLVARNAYFNVMKLGAEVTGYHVDFYGPMDDGVNSGDETDRCVVSWRLSTPRAVAAAAGDVAVVDIAGLRAQGAVDVLRVSPSGDPVVTGETGSIRLLQLPRDAVALRQENPVRAALWRRTLRTVLLPAFDEGYAVVGVTRDSSYIVARPDG